MKTKLNFIPLSLFYIIYGDDQRPIRSEQKISEIKN